MIAKNEEALIKNAFDSVKLFVDEMIVVDTGSTDATRQIAQECGATVYDFKWVHDFSKAKNFAKSMAKSDWILFLDADECFSKADGEDLRKLLADLKSKEKDMEEIVGFSFISRHYTKEEGKYTDCVVLQPEQKQQLTKEFPVFEEFNGYYDVLAITRLFKNVPSICFQGHVHEDVNPSIIEWNQKEPIKTIMQLQVPIHHLHFLKSREYVHEKQRLYFELSKERVKHVKDTKTCIDLATGYALFEKNLPESYEWVKESVLVQAGFDKTKLNAIDAVYQNNKQLRALHELLKCLDLQVIDGNTVMNLAKAYYHIKAYRVAIVVLKRLFDAVPGDPLIIEYLGSCYDKIKYVDDAIRVFEHGIIVHPEHTVFYFNLGALYEKIKAWNKAIAAFTRAIELNHPLKEQLEKRIVMLKDIATGRHVHYNVNVGDV